MTMIEITGAVFCYTVSALLLQLEVDGRMAVASGALDLGIEQNEGVLFLPCFHVFTSTLFSCAGVLCSV